MAARVLAAVAAALGLAIAALPALAVVLPPVYITQWGTTGAGPGQFSGPSGVAVDGAGNVYVTDTGNNRVQEFDANGVFITQWGTLGSGPGQFSGPFGIAVRSGNVYVVDTGNDRIQQFTSSGTFVAQWGSAGTGNGQFQQPLCIAIDPYGYVYVTDYNLNRVQQFTGSGFYLNQWGTTGTGTGQFMGMAGITADAAYDLYITDSGNHRVQEFTTSGSFVGQWGTSGSGNGQFQYPFGIANWTGTIYTADTFNHRIQMFDSYGSYQTQFGAFGTGTTQFNYPHAVAVEFGLVYVADTENDRIQKFGPAPPEQCLACFSPPDTCCEGVPSVGGPWSSVLVGTRQPGYSGYPYCVTIFDLTSPGPTPPEDNNWALMNRYNGPGTGWVSDSLGTVFGLTLDKNGNIFVTQTSCYTGDLIGQVFGAGPGAIYRLDGATGAINTFCTLPNFPDGGLSPPDNFPELGNITYDCRHDQFFVTDLEDGKIYRIKPTGTTGTVVETFDPMTPDNGAPGFAPKGERLWGVQWHGDRVYYSVWASDLTGTVGPNEIRSVGLLPSGAFNAGSDQHELFLPFLPNQTFSMPVADISFSQTGKMLLGERGIQQDSYSAPHLSRVFEYVCNAGCWVPGNNYLIGDYGAQTNASGGVDYDWHTWPGTAASPIGRVWATGDALHLYGSYPDAVYGYQGMRPNTNGSNLNSKLVDSDGNVVNGDKTYVGDIEAPGCPVTDFGTLCGSKFLDANHNGVKDGTETGISGWTIQLTGPGGTITTTTDANGNFCFTNVAPGNYTLSEVGVSPYVQTAPAGGTYAISIAAGQTLTGYAFGNYIGQGGSVPCVDPPPNMAAWWPFNEPTTSTTAGDATHPSPPRNVAQLYGSAAITAGGAVKRALCFPTELDYAKVPYANQLGLQWSAGPFAMDVWVKAPAGGSPRIIAEHRKLISPSPYRTLGWALYLNGLQAYLEIGIGVSTQIVPGPTIPANTWTHLAVSVARSPASGTWYLNGAAVPAFNFTPAPGSTSANVDLYMGNASPPFGSGALAGCMDELELFSQPITAAMVAKIYAAGAAGKCPEFCSLPSVTTICKNQTSVTVCFNICNNNPTAQSYHWSLAGLPSGPGCTVAGPVTFTPPAGSITVPAGSCSAPLCVTIPRPAGLTTQNATSCYALTIVNDATGNTHTCTGTIRADFGCYCATPIPTGIVPVGRAAIGTGISIGIGFPCDPVSSLPYRLVARYTNTDHEDPLEVSLNGLPPGEPYIGTFSRQPGQPSGEIDYTVSYPNGYDGFAPYEIVLEADLDGDGQYEPVCATEIASTYDSTETVGVPGSGALLLDSVRLLASPNPFFGGGGSKVDFTLARSDRGDLSVFDLSGRRVRNLASGVLTAGTHRFTWNGRDDHDRPAPAGVYFVRLTTDRLKLESKLTKLR